MKLIRKLLGRKGEGEPESTQSVESVPAPAPALAPGSAAQATAPLRKVRMPRVSLADADEVRFLYRLLGREILLHVTNISGSGLALRKSGMEGLPLPAIGSAMEGMLQVRGEGAPVRLKVVREDAGSIGCRYEGQAPEAVVLIRRHFQLELAANDMTAVNPKYLKQPERGRFSCYRGNDGTEIRVIEDESGLDSFMIHFLGWHLEASRSKPLEVGHVHQGEEASGIRYKGTALIRDVEGSDARKGALEAALRLVELVPTLSEPHRRALLAALRSEKI